MAAMTRIGLVLGAGGLVGAAFHEGVLRALSETTGWDPRSAAVIVGTSAGSHVGAALRAGSPPAQVTTLRRDSIAQRQPRVAGARRFAPASVGVVARGLSRPGTVRVAAMGSGVLPPGRQSLAPLIAMVNRAHPTGWPAAPLWLPAVRLSDGARVVFGSDGAPDCDVGSAVAASCAIPGYYAPVHIDGERYIDGGAHSTTNADLLAGLDLDLAVVSAPMGVARGVRSLSSALQARGFMRLRLGREARAVRGGGTPVVAFSPTASDLEVMGWNAMAQGRHRAVSDRAYQSALQRLERSEADGALAVLSIPRAS
jgi:NTE family protein